MDNGPHALDLIRYLFGEINSVSAQKSNYQDIEVEDTAKLTLFLENGTLGTVDLSWSASVPSQAYLEIYGEDGAALLDLQGITYKFKTWDEWKRIPGRINAKEAFARQIDHFVDSITGKRPLIIGNEDGLKSQMAIEAAYKSIQTSDTVNMNAASGRHRSSPALK
jgi:predicted dehydrogenase